MTFGESTALGLYSNKRNCLAIQMGLTSPSDGTPIPLMRGWFKIPKGKQRMALADKLFLNISSPITGGSICGVVVYKIYT